MEFAALLQPFSSREDGNLSLPRAWMEQQLWSHPASPLPQSLVLINPATGNAFPARILLCKGLAQTLSGFYKHLRVTWGISTEEGTISSCSGGFAQAECEHPASAQGAAQHPTPFPQIYPARAVSSPSTERCHPKRLCPFQRERVTIMPS